MCFLLHQNSCWSQSAPLCSLGGGCGVDKEVCQFGVPIYVYHVGSYELLMNQ
jgi:hypothetical protein